MSKATQCSCSLGSAKSKAVLFFQVRLLQPTSIVICDLSDYISPCPFTPLQYLLCVGIKSGYLYLLFSLTHTQVRKGFH